MTDKISVYAECLSLLVLTNDDFDEFLFSTFQSAYGNKLGVLSAYERSCDNRGAFFDFGTFDGDDMLARSRCGLVKL